jgi:hypothetical protein
MVLGDVNAHTAARAFDLLHCGFNGEAVQIGHFDLGDFLYLL